MTAETQLRAIDLPGPAGKLEGLLNTGAETASHAALVCHPHPQFGGTMHNKVVYQAAKALNGFGFPVLRFNFRGVGLSQGEYDSGRGEEDDVRAALDWLEREFSLPVIVAGFSFGATMALRAAYRDPHVAALISLGTPLKAQDRVYTYDFLRDCTLPKLFVSGERDPFGPRAELEKMFALLPEPKKLVLIEAGDHFFEGRLAELRRAIEDWVREQGLGTST